LKSTASTGNLRKNVVVVGNKIREEVFIDMGIRGELDS